LHTGHYVQVLLFEIEMKTKTDSYMPCEAMVASWILGIGVDDDIASSGEDTMVHVDIISDPEALGKRKQYLSLM